MNYHMNKLDSTLLELLNILKNIKWAHKKEKSFILLVQSFGMSKNKNKNKNKKGFVSKVKKPTKGIKKDKTTYYHCGKYGY
jgi:hypothetical protein